MKKFSVLILALMALTVQAQVKVAPQMAKGMTMKYKSNSVSVIPGAQADVNVSSVDIYKVVDATDDGYVVELTTTNVESNAAEDDIAAQMTLMASNMLADVPMRLQLDKNGRVTDLLNFDEVKNRAGEMVNVMIEKLVSTMPQLASMMPVDMLKAQAMEALTKEALVDALRDEPGVLALNGRQIMTGAQEQYTDQQMKMKRMYLLMGADGKKIRTSGTLDMTKDEIKQMIIEQIEQSMPEQADAIKQNIDMMMDSGMLKMEMTETADYTLMDNGWVSTLTVEKKSEAMGQNTSTKTTVEYMP